MVICIIKQIKGRVLRSFTGCAVMGVYNFVYIATAISLFSLYKVHVIDSKIQLNLSVAFHSEW